MSDLARYGHATLAECDDATTCTTCGDVTVPVRIAAIQDGVASVEDRLGSRAQVRLDFVPGARVGDVLLVHAGVALRRLEEGS